VGDLWSILPSVKKERWFSRAFFSQEKEMFLYGGIMGVIAIIFCIMSYFYKYVTPEELGEIAKDEEKENLDLNGIPLEDRSPDGDNIKV